jgi:Xaa-Pro aminopeptidase
MIVDAPQPTADFPVIPDWEFAERMATFKEKMAQHNIDLVVIFSNLLDPSAVRYFADVYAVNESVAMVIPAQGDPILCSGQAGHEWSAYKSKVGDIRIMPEVGEVSGVEYDLQVLDFEDLFKELSSTYRVKKIGIIGDLIFPYEIYKKLERVFPGAEKVSAEGLMYDMRMRKSENELACIRKAGEIITQSFEYAVARIKPGVTELDIQADVEGQMLRLGAEAYNLSWAPMVASGPERSNLCMQRNSLRRVQEGEIIAVAAGALYEGYNAVICAPIVLGKIPDEIKKAVNVAHRALNLVSSNFRPGVTSRYLFATYMKFLEDAGYRQYTPYGSVHSLGMLECESPFFGAAKDVALVENAVVAIDAYFKGLPWGSFRIEDTFIVGPDGPECVTRFNEKHLAIFR